MAHIKLNDVSYAYPGTAANVLEQVSLDIADGEAHALLGASGSGKTTLLNLLSGLASPGQGSIMFNDTDVSVLNARQRHVAMVFQFPVLYESLSVLANLEFAARNQGIAAAECLKRARRVADELDFSSVLDERPANLSLFQKQLVAIGKALMQQDLDLVLLDEPLTAVEPSAKWRLRQVLK